MGIKRGIVFGLAALSLVACRGKAIGTANLAGTQSADVSFTADGKPLVLWADTDGEWHGGGNSRFAAHYDIDVMSGTNKLGHISCDTADAHEEVCGTKISNGNDHHGDCEIKLECVVPTIPAGPASMHVVGTIGAGTSNVKKMNINIRDK